MQASPAALFRVDELVAELEESESKIRDALGLLLDSDRIVKKKASERGERGYTYRLKTGDEDNEGGLSIA
jgi:predicted transcriptional regulator